MTDQTPRRPSIRPPGSMEHYSWTQWPAAKVKFGRGMRADSTVCSPTVQAPRSDSQSGHVSFAGSAAASPKIDSPMSSPRFGSLAGWGSFAGWDRSPSHSEPHSSTPKPPSRNPSVVSKMVSPFSSPRLGSFSGWLPRWGSQSVDPTTRIDPAARFEQPVFDRWSTSIYVSNHCCLLPYNYLNLAKYLHSF